MTAVQELIEYFTKEEKKGTSHWCIHDLIAKLYESKEMEKQIIVDAHVNGQEIACVQIGGIYECGEHYYNETFNV
jgi:hypothetical protein